MDIGPKTISSSHLSKPLITTLASNTDEEEAEVITKIASLLKSRKDPVIVIDGGMLVAFPTQYEVNILSKVPYALTF